MNINYLELIKNITWYINSTISIKGSKTIFFDPYKTTDNSLIANFVFISHPHLDNYSEKCLNKIIDKYSIIVMPENITPLNKIGHNIYVKPEQKFKIENITIETVRAYNLNKKYHLKDNNWVGYIIEMDGIRYYHAGDTDLIPEMNSIKNIDVAFLPISGIYTMNVKEALESVKLIKPKVAIPIHFGMIAGTYEDAEEFIDKSPSHSQILKIKR